MPKFGKSFALKRLPGTKQKEGCVKGNFGQALLLSALATSMFSHRLLRRL